MMPGRTNIDNDALLVAYLDGALKPEARQDLEHRLATDASLRARLGVLAEGGRQIRSSFDSLLESAPRARLDAIFAAALAKAPRRRARRYREMLLAAAAASASHLRRRGGIFHRQGAGRAFRRGRRVRGAMD